MLAVKSLFAMPVWSFRVVKALQYIEIPRLAIQTGIRKPRLGSGKLATRIGCDGTLLNNE